MIKSKTLNKIIGKNLSHKFLKDCNKKLINLNLSNNDNIEMLNYQNIFNSNITEKTNSSKQGVNNNNNNNVVKKLKIDEDGDQKDLENNNNLGTYIGQDDKEKGNDDGLGKEGVEKDGIESYLGTGMGRGRGKVELVGIEVGGEKGGGKEKENENGKENKRREEKDNNGGNNNQSHNKNGSGNDSIGVQENDKNDDNLPDLKHSSKISKKNERRHNVRKNNHINFEKYKNNSHIFQAKTRLYQKDIHLLTIDGGKACQQLQRLINMGSFIFDYIEVRACPFGCLGGGGHLKTLENPISQRMKIFQSLISKSKIPNFKKIKKRYYNVYCELKESKKFRKFPIHTNNTNTLKQEYTRKKNKQNEENNSHGKHSILILWGSQTGIAREIANVVFEKCKTLKLKPRIKSLQNLEIESLLGEESIIFVISTYWEGSFPTNAVPFWKQFKKCKLNLTNLKYSVIGVGNSSYSNFNKAAILLDNRIEKLGANRHFPIALTDSLDSRGYWTVLESFLETLKYIK
ncbi:nadph--cytochrome p450 reductase [Anaeramoeba flamelloides]|uniref:Nadph--cytochrome p450 reductase n=1 Tax=Anaeramoeba flamelloides TaxID=1746091 RepID=A0AAV8AD95_9EUKA|nr:nadph--cytochrome p450 reductase [Anaeramoeba flamelloides]